MADHKVREFVEAVPLREVLDAVYEWVCRDTTADRYRGHLTDSLRGARYWARIMAARDAAQPATVPAPFTPARLGVLAMWQTRSKHETNAVATRRIWYTVDKRFRVVESKINYLPVRYYAECRDGSAWRLLGTHRVRKTALARIDSIIRSGAAEGGEA